MNLRKRLYFKPLCLLVAALFTGQCVSIERKLISTEEKVIEDESREFIYELEKIKTPTAQDPTVEYRIVKFPANRVESVNVFSQVRKVNRFVSILGGCIVGAFIGSTIGVLAIKDTYEEVSKPVIGFAIGIPIGGVITGLTIRKKDELIGEIKVPTGRYLGKKPGSPPIPVQDFPLEFKWGSPVKSNSFKTQTNEQGIVRVNLIEDLKMTKFPLDHPLILYICYLNSESQKKGILGDSLGPKK